VIGLHGFDELRSLVDAEADTVRRSQGATPGLLFYRSEAPTVMSPAKTASLYTVFIVQGRKRVRVGGDDLLFEPPSYVVVTGEGGFDAAVVEASPAAPYLSLALSLAPEMVADTLIELVAESGQAEPSAAPLAYTARLTQPLLDALVRLLRVQADAAERRVLGPLHLREVVFHLLRSEAASGLRAATHRSGDATRIREAMFYIREHAHERLTVAKLARRFTMSASHFAHRFRDVARVSPIRYLKHARLDRARSLLLGGGRAAEVAFEVGYASSSHFTRDFKNEFGVPPGEYVRRARSELTIAGSGNSFAEPGMALERVSA
jgi:AraC-like DNA-binding protein